MPMRFNPYTAQEEFVNDDGSIWNYNNELPSWDPANIRPDLRDSVKQQNLANVNADYDSRMVKFTQEQAQAYLAGGVNPFPGTGIYNDSMYGGKNLWSGEAYTPTDSGPNILEHNLPWDKSFRGGLPGGKDDGVKEMWPGLAVMFGGPAAGAAGTAIAAGAAGAGATGAGTVGLDASTGLFSGETATAATTGATGFEALAGSGGTESLLGNAGGDTLSGTEAGFDPGGEGIFNAPTTSANTIYPNGMDQSTFSGYLKQAKELAAQFGITPASALKSIMSAAGRAAPAVLGAVGANQQANSLQGLADKYMALGEPSRARYEASFAPGFSMANDPGYADALGAASKATLHGLSVNGNPAGSPNAWAQSLSDLYSKTAYPALQNFRNTNANAGGIASLQTAAPSAATGAINAQGNVFNAIGAGANDIFNPQPTLAQTLAEYKRLLGTAA